MNQGATTNITSEELDFHLEEQAKAMIPTPWGNFMMHAFSDKNQDRMPHLALVHENFKPGSAPIHVRLHSECITGDLFGSKRCDCGEQLNQALQVTAEHGGMVIYLRQEGRGIGIINKLKAYQLQDKGLNTIDANLHLQLPVDARDYEVAKNMLSKLGVEQIHLLTNNPDKISAFDTGAVKVVSRIPLIIAPEAQNADYLQTKKDHMGHLIGN